MLFADWTPGTILFLVIMLGIAVVYGLVQWWLLTNHPEAWRILNQQAHERRMAWQQRQREREADRRAMKHKALGAAGGLLRLFLGRR
ncbi:MAG: hypothetical protein HY040_07500 [Planctomycetes bacterium]|nr:hypothetical protein [Planctomycetota bacterium]